MIANFKYLINTKFQFATKHISSPFYGISTLKIIVKKPIRSLLSFLNFSIPYVNTSNELPLFHYFITLTTHKGQTCLFPLPR